jgi:glycosyltransferase involved in cell wall biosynthesis
MREQTSPKSNPSTSDTHFEAGVDITWRWSSKRFPGALTAVVRARNEARNLPVVLPPLLRSVSRVIVVDNGSTDETAAVAHEVSDTVASAARLDVLEYRFEVARCGSEHRDTPPDSPHSLVRFYNWSFSHVETSYALKWDADMVLTRRGETIVRDLAFQLENVDAVVTIERPAVWILAPDRALVQRHPGPVEAWAWPNRPEFRFVKAMDWETLDRPTSVRHLRLPPGTCFEIKRPDEDEFANWTSTVEIETAGRAGRKLHEMEVNRAILNGVTPEGYAQVTSPPGVDVIEHLRQGGTDAL